MIYDVAIVGGGPVGMGLAIELGQRGVRVCVVERYPQPQPIPKGQNLTQRTMEHMHAWGCEPAMRAARSTAGIGGMTTYGTLLSDYHYDWLNRARVNDYYFARNERLPQYETERILRARAAEVEGVDILYDCTCEGLGQTGEAVTLDLRTPQGPATITARYAVGCDGSRSVVRRAAGITQTLADHDRRMALLVFRSRELDALLARYPGKAFFNVLDPGLEGYWKFFGRVDRDEAFFFHAPVPAGTDESSDFAPLLHEAVGMPFALSFDHVGFWDLRFAIADSYRAGRVFIAGDAAHSHPPYGGFGINTGFEDARNLGWKLAARLQGWGGEALLDSYDAERRPVFASTADDFIARFIAEDRDFLAAYSPDKDRAAFETAWEARKSAAEVEAFEPNYEGSPIVTGPPGTPSARGDHRFEARAGHHLAPQTLADGTSVFDRLGPGFTLLSFGTPGAAEGFACAAKARGLPLTVVEGEAATEYGARLILVRPDHYVAWAGDDAEDAAAVLDRAAPPGGG